MTVRGAERLAEANVKVLRLEPGDEIVLQVTDHRKFPPAALAELQSEAEARWPGHRVTVVAGIELVVVRKP